MSLYLGAGLVAVAVSFAGLPGDRSAEVSMATVVAAFVVGQQLVRYDARAQFGGFFAAALFVVSVNFAVPMTVLAVHGERVSATVADLRSVTPPLGMGSHYRYGLVDAQGRRIAGFLVEPSRAFVVGDQIMVVVDRRDWVAPQTTNEVDEARPYLLAALIGFVLTVAMSLIGGHSRGDGPPPERGLFGIWIFSR